MSDFPKANAFKKQRIEALKSYAVHGVAITQQIIGDQFATVGPDLETAVRRARSIGLDPDPNGAQEVVILRAVDFTALLKLAGIADSEASA